MGSMTVGLESHQRASQTRATESASLSILLPNSRVLPRRQS